MGGGLEVHRELLSKESSFAIHCFAIHYTVKAFDQLYILRWSHVMECFNFKSGRVMWIMELIHERCLGWPNIAELIFGDLLKIKIWQDFSWQNHNNYKLVLQVWQSELTIKDMNTKENVASYPISFWQTDKLYRHTRY